MKLVDKWFISINVSLMKNVRVISWKNQNGRYSIARIHLTATWWCAIAIGRSTATTSVPSAYAATIWGLLNSSRPFCLSHCFFGKPPTRSFLIDLIRITVWQGFLIVSSRRQLLTPSLSNTIDSLFLSSQSQNRLNQGQDAALDSQRISTSSK